MADVQLDSLVVKIRADTTAVRDSVARATADLGLLGVGAEAVSQRMENAFVRFARTGEFNFKSLRALALGVLGDIAASAVQSGFQSIIGAIGGTSGGVGGLLSGLGSLLGLPGRASGGLVTAGRPYIVGERGPELFVPQSAGRVQAGGGAGTIISVTINMNGDSRANPRASQQSANQVASAVRRALARSEGLA